MPRKLAKPQVQHSNADILNSYRRHLLAEGRSLTTLPNYLIAVRQFVKFLESEAPGTDLLNASRADVEAWMVSLRGQFRPATIWTRHVNLRGFFDWLVREEEIPRSPFGPRTDRRLRPPVIPESPKDVVPTEKLAELFRRFDRKREWRDAVIVSVLYDTGMRASELANTLTEYVNLEGGTILIPTTKGKRVRVVRISPPTTRYIDRYWRKPRRAPEYMVNGNRGAMTRSGVYQVVSALFEGVGLPGIGPHDLRHTSATHQVLSGEITEASLMALMGWQSPEMARHYTNQGRVQAAFRDHEKSSPMTRLLGR